MYGFLQYTKLWYEHFSTEVVDIGQRRSTVANCMFILGGQSPCYVIVCVDDLIIIGTYRVVDETKNDLAQMSTVTDLGYFPYFLGIKIVHIEPGMLLSQGGYVRKVVQCPLSAHSQTQPVPAAARAPFVRGA